MGPLLALGAAATFGVADFLGGRSARHAPVVAVTALTNVAGGILAVVLLVVVGGRWSPGAVVWGTAGGAFGLFGLVLLYSGLASGANALVSPLSAVVAAVVPVTAGIALGDRPGHVAMLGLSLTAPAIWLLAGGELRMAGTARRPLVFGLGAGVGFGTFFTLLAQAPDDAGAVPLLMARIVSVTVLLGAVLVIRPGMPAPRWQGVSLVAGALDMSANGLFLWSTRHGDLAVVGALVSLFPATTVILAVVVLGERLRRSQQGGLVLALVAAALLS